MKNANKLTWIGTACAVFVFGLVVTFTPRVEAEQSDQATQQYIDRIQYAFNFILQNYVEEIPPEKLYEGAMEGLFESLDDPYSYYLTASDMEDLTDTTTGKFGGVGLYISKPAESESDQQSDNGRDAFIKVVAPIEDTPAYRAGIHAGDYITKIEDESTKKLTVDDVVDRLRGEPGSTVTVTILRGKDITFDVDITRAIIEIPTVKHSMIHDTIGYIRIIQFTPYTDDRVQEALREFKQKNYTKLIIDVRQNPGGLLTSVADTVDLIQSEGTIVSTRSRIAQENEVFSADPAREVAPDIPIVVLIDQGSASASEILAGALKDTGRGILIGQTSFGKGSVQKIIPFGRSGFKLTISRYYTPSGVNIDKVGIDPDIEVKEPELTEADNDDLKQIFEKRLLSKFVDENPEASDSEKEAFVERLRSEYNIKIEERILRRLLRNEFQRRMDFPPVYDLEYDQPLQKAVQMLEDGRISDMIDEARKNAPAAGSAAEGAINFDLFDFPATGTERKEKPKP
ncbi:MAG: S41 family peptidase [Spirochaetia bacterium]|nr:S41 family peptidase [Spirochaetia bacterium]